MNKELPERKRNRLRNFDYSSVGIYFLTICTAERRNYFWSNLNVGACIARPQNAETPSINVGATIGRPQPFFEITSPEDIELSDWGKIVDEAITNIPNIYPAILVEKYVIMPDHIHLLLHICADEYGRPIIASSGGGSRWSRLSRLREIRFDGRPYDVPGRSADEGIRYKTDRCCHMVEAVL